MFTPLVWLEDRAPRCKVSKPCSSHLGKNTGLIVRCQGLEPWCLPVTAAQRPGLWGRPWTRELPGRNRYPHQKPHQSRRMVRNKNGEFRNSEFARRRTCLTETRQAWYYTPWGLHNVQRFSLRLATMGVWWAGTAPASPVRYQLLSPAYLHSLTAPPQQKVPPRRKTI